MLRRLRDEARAISARDALKQLLDAYNRNDLLTFASAIAFKVLFALIPFALFGLALMSSLGLSEVWSEDLAPTIEDSVSPAAYELIDDSAKNVLESRQLFWLTAGALIAVWEISGATRAIMDVFDRIYGADRERSFGERYRVSIVLSLASAALILAAVAVIELVPLVVDGPLSFLRYPVAVVLLCASCALLVRFAPADADRHPSEWVSFGILLVVAAWLGTSLAFAFYLTSIAHYGSIFGALATIIVTLEYLYLSSIAFLTGAQIDALVRARVEGDPSGENGHTPGLERRRAAADEQEQWTIPSSSAWSHGARRRA
jgi:membrane protein